MFISHLWRVYRSSNLIIVRELRNRALGKGPANPGMERRIQAFRKEGLQITDDDAEEFIEQSESDLFQAGFAYEDHLQETVAGKHELKHHIVKQKYFKEYFPNLLTWSEKEQIRHLHNEQPDEWTPERLAESFPVTVAVVKKLLKYPWKPASEERIARHDASAMRNWKELREGRTNLPKDLQEHFLKFSNRTIPPLRKESVKIDLTREIKMGEFESIVNKCAAQEEAKKNTYTSNTENIDDSKTYQKVVRDKKILTLDELAAKIKNRMEKGRNVDVSDEMMVDTIKSTEQNDLSVQNEIELVDMKQETKIINYEDKSSHNKSIMDYPERIRIPKKAYKRGATYKVNDCYYDHDGKFLYRVLGMSN